MTAKAANNSKSKFKSLAINLTLLLVTSSIALGIGEYIFRKLIFNEDPTYAHLRIPELYTHPENDTDYWKLYYRFNGKYKPPSKSHRSLGWAAEFWHESYMHHRIDNVKGRRPVLLYGDSFAYCVKASKCFQEILNADSTFAEDHYLMNYGVGGYGVDQISMLYHKTASHYRKPFVVFSLLDTDLDRSILNVRTSQKPFYTIEGDSLEVNGIPIDTNQIEYFENHPPEIKSYLYRRFLHSDLNVLPQGISDWLTGETQAREWKIELNTKILEGVIQDLRENDIDFIFLIFHKLYFEIDFFGEEANNNWRLIYLKEFLEKNNVPYIWAKDVILEDRTYDAHDYDKYFVPEDGHPTTHLNSLISAEIKKAVMQDYRPSDSLSWRPDHSFTPIDTSFYLDHIYKFEKKVPNDSSWYEWAKRKALEKDISLEESIFGEAEWIVGHKYYD